MFPLIDVLKYRICFQGPTKSVISIDNNKYVPEQVGNVYERISRDPIKEMNTIFPLVANSKILIYMHQRILRSSTCEGPAK